MARLAKYIKNILIGIDQLINTILGGDPDETLSSRAGKWAMAGIKLPARVIDRIFGKGHCNRSIEEDEGKDRIIF